MDRIIVERTTVRHVVAMPYPGRGHINPMMNLCKLLASRSDDILITFVLTEEWLGFIGSESKPANMCFRSIPNVVPSELVRGVRGANLGEFFEAVFTKMEEPFERLLDRLEPPATTIIADTYLLWAVDVGNRRNIPVASFWPMSASVFSVLYHFDLLLQNRHFPVEVSERGDECVDYIPGVSAMRVADLPTHSYTKPDTLKRVMEVVSKVHKAQYLLFTSIYKLEAQVIDALKPRFPFPVYSVGPTIPHYRFTESSSLTTSHNDLDYLKWLDSQPRSSVLYISLGSFLSVSSTQMDEIAAGLRDSGVRYLWVARWEASRFKDGCGDMGLVVPWCDQLRVLCHSSIGGFWTHCGWNSTLEGVFASVPVLTFPIIAEQVHNSKLIVEDWKIGWRVKTEMGVESLVKRERIAGLVTRLMDLESNERKEISSRARVLQEICRQAIAKGGSSETNINAFLRDIS